MYHRLLIIVSKYKPEKQQIIVNYTDYPLSTLNLKIKKILVVYFKVFNSTKMRSQSSKRIKTFFSQ